MSTNKKISVIIPAGGVGKRMKYNTPKQFICVNDKPIIAYTIENLSKVKCIDEIIVAVPKDYIAYFNNIIKEFSLKKVKKVIIGGATRQDTVYKCLIDGVKNEFVLIHDAVRPLIDTNIVKASIDEAYKYGASAVGKMSTDTIKIADENGFISETIDRNKVWLIETPQIFKTDLLVSAHESAIKENYVGTDDCALVERLGHRIKLVLNDSINTKITYRDDLKVLEAFNK
ncbi:MAG: 2-C-methyl-D-erythritol 4-phosphate cytidylyltransferase [Ruminococcaceae bacterium]|nr:2-C-methyl-D-erythritol 4-phosphate cytidylyltransferase [Oscillospiraceae bacterium]